MGKESAYQAQTTVRSEVPSLTEKRQMRTPSDEFEEKASGLPPNAEEASIDGSSESIEDSTKAMTYQPCLETLDNLGAKKTRQFDVKRRDAKAGFKSSELIEKLEQQHLKDLQTAAQRLLK